jgi:hypothetical protein
MIHLKLNRHQAELVEKALLTMEASIVSSCQTQLENTGCVDKPHAIAAHALSLRSIREVLIPIQDQVESQDDEEE